MSILMTVTFENEGEAFKAVPVATLDAFRHFWVPAARDCGLGLIQVLEGLDVTSEQVPLIMDELARLRTWFHDHLVPEQAGPQARSVDRVLAALSEVPKGRKVIISFR